MKKYSLIKFTNSKKDTFIYIMLNANKPLKNYQCNSALFINKEDATKNIDTLEYFNCKIDIIEKNIDRRKKQYKNYKYFSYGFCKPKQK